MALVNCAECDTKISDKAKLCPKCGCPTLLNEGAVTTNIVNSQEVNSNNINSSSVDIISRIDNLKVSLNQKVIFKLIASTRVLNKFIGIPLFELNDKRLKPWSLFNKISIGSNFGFFLGPIYYIFTGMWRKGILILSIIIFTTILKASVGGSLLDILDKTVPFVMAILAYSMATYDRYRTLVLKEKFWW